MPLYYSGRGALWGVTEISTSDCGLSRRELEVLQCRANGLRNRGTAKELGIAEVTVKQYVHSYLKKLGAKNTAEAVAIAMRMDLIS